MPILPNDKEECSVCASRELVHAQKRMLLLGRKTASERLASFLRERFLLNKAALGHLALPMTRMDIADYLGLTIETVSRTFSAFQRQGLIHIPHTRNVLIQDIDALSALADDDITSKRRPSDARNRSYTRQDGKKRFMNACKPICRAVRSRAALNTAFV
ncbi:MAG: helix-turn-helix domain-containing protein [Acetobacteraceae bacterium]